MSAARIERRLAAVLSLDVVDYSRKMEEDETGTVLALESLRALVRSRIERSGGRLFGVAGDSMMAEFPAALDALVCAIELQERQARAESPLVLRVGAHVGDFIVRDEDLFGDGINIAARLQQGAPPGGICASDELYRNVRTRLTTQFDDLGIHTFKNLHDPIRVWQKSFSELSSSAPRLEEKASLLIRRARDQRPSIVILPFINLSEDEANEHFCDGLTRDLSSELSRFRNVTVIAPHSAFRYKARKVEPESLQRELGVEYFTEGSFRTWGGMFRVDVQLVDLKTQREIWAERFTRELAELPALPEEIIQSIVSRLALEVSEEEQRRAIDKDTTDLTAYELYQRGVYVWANDDRNALDEARRLFELATKRDPTFARAWGYLSYTYSHVLISRWDSSSELVDRAFRYAKRAIRLDPEDYSNHWDMAYAFLSVRRIDEAVAAYQRAARLNPNDADLLTEMAEAMTFLGRADGALEQVERAMRINPLYPDWYKWVKAFAHYARGEYATAIEELRTTYTLHTDSMILISNCYAHQGNVDRAREIFEVFLREKPHWSIADERRRMAFKDGAKLEHWLEGVRMSGLPEESLRRRGD